MASKALVISNVDFSTNKLTTVTITNPIPCTALALNVSTLAITAIGSTGSLTATKTPANTTDTLSWASSDESVATVSNGTVTAAGCGTATITATCGTQNATCTVTVTNVMQYSYGLARFASTNNNRQYVKYDGNSDNFAMAVSPVTLTGKKKLLDNKNYSNKWAIMLSPGATKINFTIPSTFRVTVFFVNSETASAASGYEDYAAFIDGDANSYDTNVPVGNREVTIPSGADAVAFAIQNPGSGNTVTDEDMATVVAIES